MESLRDGSAVPEPWFDSLPGEVVMEHLHDPRRGDNAGLEFRVRRLIAKKHFPKDSPDNVVQRKACYEAATPYRHCVYPGRTLGEALGALMLGVGLLSRDGSLDPSVPHAQGSPIIQHVLHVLSERLAWHVARRREKLISQSVNPEEEASVVSATGLLNRENEVIAALGTAISSLARIKDL